MLAHCLLVVGDQAVHLLIQQSTDPNSVTCLKGWRVATAVGHGLQRPGRFMDHILNLSDISGSKELSGAVVHLLEKSTSSLSDSVLIWSVAVNQDWLDVMAFKTFNELALKFQSLVIDQKGWTSEGPQPASKKGGPY